MFAVMLTFAEVILQTIIGYKREQEKKLKNDIKKIAPMVSTTTTMSLQSDQYDDERPNSSRWNLIFGRIVFPLIFISFTLIYSIIAISYIFTSNIDIQNLQKC